MVGSGSGGPHEVHGYCWDNLYIIYIYKLYGCFHKYGKTPQIIHLFIGFSIINLQFIITIWIYPPWNEASKVLPGNGWLEDELPFLLAKALFSGAFAVSFREAIYIYICISGQIIATSHDRFPPNGGLVREIPLFQGNLGWWNIIPFGQIYGTYF